MLWGVSSLSEPACRSLRRDSLESQVAKGTLPGASSESELRRGTLRDVNSSSELTSQIAAGAAFRSPAYAELG